MSIPIIISTNGGMAYEFTGLNLRVPIILPIKGGGRMNLQT